MFIDAEGKPVDVALRAAELGPMPPSRRVSRSMAVPPPRRHPLQLEVAALRIQYHWPKDARSVEWSDPVLFERSGERSDDTIECLLDYVLRVGGSALSTMPLALTDEHKRYGPSLFALDEDEQPTAGELAQLSCDFLHKAGVVTVQQIRSLGRGKILRKAVSTLLHSLPSSPFSDSDLASMILHSRSTWQRAYTIARCERHNQAWLALSADDRRTVSVADVVRL